jgi:RNA polymerase sigma factor (sigma-70 family)
MKSTAHSDPPAPPDRPGPPKGRAYFATTQWSLVVAAGKKSSPEAAQALEQLCRTYWYPLYAYVRRSGHTCEDAQDLTQKFFARLLTRNFIAGVSPAKGRFRDFLLACLKNHLADARDYDQAQVRDVRKALALDGDLAETRYRRELADNLSPDKFFDRKWALELLNATTGRLREEYVKAGKSERFDQLSVGLAGERGGPSHAELAAQLGISPEYVRVAVHRLRQRFRQLLEEEVARTVASPAQFKEEIQYLLGLWSK